MMGGLCGATVVAAGGESIALGMVLGVIGGIVGTYGGYQARTRLVKALGVRDVVTVQLALAGNFTAGH